jgi:pyridoxal 5'-phosphate synthase pdxS subunit
MGANESFQVKVGLAEMLKGGVICGRRQRRPGGDRRGAGPPRHGAERVPAGIRRDAGSGAHVARLQDPRDPAGGVDPGHGRCRIGLIGGVLEALGVDFIDESEVLTPADAENHVYKHDFRVPFVRLPSGRGVAARRVPR